MILWWFMLVPQGVAVSPGEGCGGSILVVQCGALSGDSLDGRDVELSFVVIYEGAQVVAALVVDLC